MVEVDCIGSVATGALAAREAERLDLGDAHDVRGACLNCGAALAGPYCAWCGQAAHVHRTLASLGHDFLHGVFHFEGKLWATLPMLARRPGELTRRYIDGERAKFISPMALLLFSVFLLFAAISRLDLPDVASSAQSLVAAKQQLLKRQEDAEDKLRDLRKRAADAGGGKASSLDAEIARAQKEVAALRRAAAEVPSQPFRASEPMSASIDAVPVETGVGWLDRQIRHVQDNPQLYAYKLKSASYKYSWALIPISLPFIWLMFWWRRDVGLYDHAIFAIYSLSFATLLAVALIGLALLGVGAGWLWLAMLVVPPIHMFKQLRGTYRLGRFGALWRTMALLVSVTVASGLFAALLVWMEAD